jgi:hypothetical protein
MPESESDQVVLLSDETETELVKTVYMARAGVPFSLENV